MARTKKILKAIHQYKDSKCSLFPKIEKVYRFGSKQKPDYSEIFIKSKAYGNGSDSEKCLMKLFPIFWCIR